LTKLETVWRWDVFWDTV